MSEASPHLQSIQEKLGSKVLSAAQAQGDDVVLLDRSGLRESFRALTEEAGLSFDFLSDITAGCACVCPCLKTTPTWIR